MKSLKTLLLFLKALFPTGTIGHTLFTLFTLAHYFDSPYTSLAASILPSVFT